LFESVVFLKFVNIGKSFEKCLLGNVFRVMDVAQHAQAEPEHQAGFYPDKAAVSLFVSGTTQSNQLCLRCLAQLVLLAYRFYNTDEQKSKRLTAFLVIYRF